MTHQTFVVTPISQTNELVATKYLPNFFKHFHPLIHLYPVTLYLFQWPFFAILSSFCFIRAYSAFMSLDPLAVSLSTSHSRQIFVQAAYSLRRQHSL